MSGRRVGRPRLFVDGERYQVRLPRDIAVRLRAIGAGSLSSGIVWLLYAYDGQRRRDFKR